MSSSGGTKSSQRFSPWQPWLILCALAIATTGCTRFSTKKSSLRDILGSEQESSGPLKQMTIKYFFTFLGSAGQRYPIYMNSEITVREDLNEAIWNSSIESDGGLISAINESKTLKPDKNLQLKAVAPQTPERNSPLVFKSGNPELGQGLSLTVQKVVSRGSSSWKATSLSYFGYDAQIEDSVANTSETSQPR